MTEIDWNKPIDTGVFHARAEQLRRADILIAAAGGRPLTQATAAARVKQLAKVVPGLRWVLPSSRHRSSALPITVSSITLAPGWGKDDLPGRSGGRPQRWTEEGLMAFARVVDQLRHGLNLQAAITAQPTEWKPPLAQDATADRAALQTIHDDMSKSRPHAGTPSIRTLENRLREGRKLLATKT